MKKFFVLTAFFAIVFILSNCSSSKKSTSSSNVHKATYAADVQSIITTNCTPCHFPSKGGNKKPLDTYESVKANIDDIIRRIELNPTDKGFMPFKHPKLSDSTIAVFKQWRDNGMN